MREGRGRIEKKEETHMRIKNAEEEEEEGHKTIQRFVPSKYCTLRH